MKDELHKTRRLFMNVVGDLLQREVHGRQDQVLYPERGGLLYETNKNIMANGGQQRNDGKVLFQWLNLSNWMQKTFKLNYPRKFE